MEDKNPTISVIILNWNGLDYLKKTIPPLREFDYPNYEIIVVDNGSTDNSVNFLKKFKNIKVIRNETNIGYSKGKNIGIKKAKGEYILFLDNDILIKDRNILKKLLRVYFKKSNIAFLQITLLDKNRNKTHNYGVYYTIYGSHKHKKEPTINEIINYKKDLVEIASPTGGFFFIKKSIWNNIGGFDESQNFHIDDVDVGPRAIIFGYKNFLYTKSHAIHLGINKTKSAKAYYERFNLLFSGNGRSIIKNYNLKNLVTLFPVFSIFHLGKTIKYSFKKRSFKIFIAFFNSIIIFVKVFPDTLRQRKKIQSKRIIKEDLFLKIKPPKFN
jgi:GT2 family glycosyltransferase